MILICFIYQFQLFFWDDESILDGGRSLWWFFQTVRHNLEYDYHALSSTASPTCNRRVGGADWRAGLLENVTHFSNKSLSLRLYPVLFVLCENRCNMWCNLWNQNSYCWYHKLFNLIKVISSRKRYSKIFFYSFLRSVCQTLFKMPFWANNNQVFQKYFSGAMPLFHERENFKTFVFAPRH